MIEIGVTIKDVAKKTGLSIATISKYINGGNVLECNKEKIQSAIDELGFTVNEMARGLKTNKSKVIGVLIPNLRNIFFTTIISKIEDILVNNGYAIIICDYKQNSELEKEKLEFLLNKGVDGIVLIPLGSEKEEVEKLIDKKMPVVLIDRMIDGLDCDVVLGDNLNASYAAVEKFIVNGHKRIGVIVGPEDMYTAAQRLKGYYRVHEDYSINIDKSLIRYGDYKIESGYTILNELLDLENPPTAIYVTNYEMTLGAIMAVNERKLNIPDDLSLIGFDNIELVKVINPPLSVIVQPMELIGSIAANVLLDRLSGNYRNYPSVNRLKAELIVTESIGKLNK